MSGRDSTEFSIEAVEYFDAGEKKIKGWLRNIVE